MTAPHLSLVQKLCLLRFSVERNEIFIASGAALCDLYRKQRSIFDASLSELEIYRLLTVENVLSPEDFFYSHLRDDCDWKCEFLSVFKALFAICFDPFIFVQTPPIQIVQTKRIPFVLYTSTVFSGLWDSSLCWHSAAQLVCFCTESINFYDWNQVFGVPTHCPLSLCAWKSSETGFYLPRSVRKLIIAFEKHPYQMGESEWQRQTANLMATEILFLINWTWLQF